MTNQPGTLPVPDERTMGRPRLPALRAVDDDIRRIGLAHLSILALVVGLVTGVGAVGFRDLIGLIHNILFLGHVAVRYDANLFTPPSPWGPFVILVPVVGGLAVTFLVTKFAPEARGHGVPEVMDAIYYKGGVIRPVVALVKSLASAIAIGSGAAVGREGPIIQIGSTLGSTLGQIVRMPAGQRTILVAAGAGAGIAATFNTPIGGVMFAIELMMPEVSVRTFLPVAISTGTATFIGRFFLGQQPAFAVPALPPLSTDASSAVILCLYALLGAVMGLAATGFIRALQFAEDLFDKVKERYARHVLGMLIVGTLIYVLFESFGHYYVEGVGYATVQAILLGQLSVTMIFEMTRNYDIVMPMILAVALSVGVRRMLSRENIYTLKLSRRGHVIPKALHANMFLVRRAKEVMDTDVVVAPADMSFDTFLSQPEHQGRMRHVVVADSNRIYGVLRVNTALRQVHASAEPSLSLRAIASRNFTVAYEDDIIFEVIRRLWRKRAIMALVVRKGGVPRPGSVAGVITKEHVADSVANSVKTYPG